MTGSGGIASAPRYAVMGHPVAHSKSPLIHQDFARQFGQSIDYQAIDVPEGGLGAAVAEFRRQGGCGLNVTLPHKQAAHALCSELDERARASGSVNVILLSGQDGCRGMTTDGIGLLRDLQCNLGLSLEGAEILVLGAGGSCRAILPALGDALPRRVAVANRTFARAQALLDAIPLPCSIKALALSDLPDAGAFDLIISASSAGLTGAFPSLPDGLLKPGGVCYDLIYAPEETPFALWGRGQGAALSCDGWGMLVEQAAESYFLWRGIRPCTKALIERRGVQ